MFSESCGLVDSGTKGYIAAMIAGYFLLTASWNSNRPLQGMHLFTALIISRMNFRPAGAFKVRCRFTTGSHTSDRFDSSLRVGVARRGDSSMSSISLIELRLLLLVLITRRHSSATSAALRVCIAHFLTSPSLPYLK